ncbi:MAG: rhodanese-like domain-containing protein [Acidimicrobiales bacterium]
MDVPEIDVEELARRRADGAPVIDVRMPDEYEDFHVAGAQLVPLPEVPDRLDDIPRDQTVYLICKGGGRSRKATEFLLGQGYDAVNVAGGSDAWREAGHPVATGSEAG